MPFPPEPKATSLPSAKVVITQRPCDRLGWAFTHDSYAARAAATFARSFPRMLVPTRSTSSQGLLGWVEDTEQGSESDSKSPHSCHIPAAPTTDTVTVLPL